MKFLKIGNSVLATDSTQHSKASETAKNDEGVVLIEKDPIKSTKGDVEIPYVIKWQDGSLTTEPSWALIDLEKPSTPSETDINKTDLEISADRANSLLEEWKEKLMLMDWTIKLDLLDDDEADKENPTAAGWNNVQPSIKCSKISIRKYTNKAEYIMKQPFEQILIHELLHCKFGLDEMDESFVGEYNHQQLEDLSKSLFMAKYGLTLDYFKNF